MPNMQYTCPGCDQKMILEIGWNLIQDIHGNLITVDTDNPNCRFYKKGSDYGTP